MCQCVKLADASPTAPTGSLKGIFRKYWLVDTAQLHAVSYVILYFVGLQALVIITDHDPLPQRVLYLQRQGDSGHAQVKMVADVYSHIIDDDRRINAQRFEEQFYQPKPVDSITLEVKEPGLEETASDQEVLLKLLANPETAALLKALAKNL